jgi:CubicO group peptidase (beta-lactamase class C family)
MNNTLRTRMCLALMMACLAWDSSWASDLPRASPQELGFSAERLNAIDDYYMATVNQGEMAGMVLLIARRGRVAHFSALGYADISSRQKMQKDAIFRLYSMTKPIAATALMILYEEGKFQIDDPISKYIPEFVGIRVLRAPDAALTDTVPAKREPTIHDLFRHTAGFQHGAAEPPKAPIDEAYQKADLFNPTISLEEMTKRLAKIPLREQPGTRVEYSLGQDVQARLVEIFSGLPFDRFLDKRLFAPLGMKDTAHWVTPDKASRLVPVHWANAGKLVPCDTKHGCDGLAVSRRNALEIQAYTNNNARKGGSTGLTGTAEDYWRFAQMMLNGGELDGQRILSPSTVRYMARDHLGSVTIPNANGEPSGVGWGLGFAVLQDPVAAGINGSEGSYYWAGAANTTFWIDPKQEIVVVAMTQHMKVPTVDWPTIRQQLSAMVHGALME